MKTTHISTSDAIVNGMPFTAPPSLLFLEHPQGGTPEPPNGPLSPASCDGSVTSRAGRHEPFGRGVGVGYGIERSASHRNKILLVGNQPADLEILRRTLPPNSRLETAVDGEECLRKTLAFKPHLVLLDVLLPGLDAHETCRRIKSDGDGAFTQVILLTADDASADHVLGDESPADDYLVKPFDHAELRSKIRVQLRLRRSQWELHNAKTRLELYASELERAVQHRTRQLTATQDMAVFALAQLTDSRDSATGEHLVRIRFYAQTLAERLAMDGPYRTVIDSRFLHDLFRASPLHDIGKVAIPDAILQKPGPLTPEEREIMKRHVLVGAETLEKAKLHLGKGTFMDMAADIARYHHERFDGQGYCEGLRGEQIPPAARIVALADVYDALTSRRAYKEAMPHEEAYRWILQQSGTHFDPAVVEAFVDCFQRFLQFDSSQYHEPASWLSERSSHPGVALDVDNVFDALESILASTP